ncbi:hypothetical protein [Leptospira kmetyi]|uniref:hypothetical protein n=1 Tax=Leptospira kmetyi TaxID=408139 RepID=UPI0010842B4E|nr:hypothetical protein [Leptospira kmetyi]TGL69370.1 hypothetical protein EHQ67_08945 [Leptospira kmetyi]
MQNRIRIINISRIVFVSLLFFFIFCNKEYKLKNCTVEEKGKVCTFLSKNSTLNRVYANNSDIIELEVERFEDRSIIHREYQSGKLIKEEFFIGPRDEGYHQYRKSIDRPFSVPANAIFVSVDDRWIVKTIVNKQLSGSYEEYFRDGKPNIITTVKDGAIEGDFIMYDEKSNVIFKAFVDSDRTIHVEKNVNKEDPSLFLRRFYRNSL